MKRILTLSLLTVLIGAICACPLAAQAKWEVAPLPFDNRTNVHNWDLTPKQAYEAVVAEMRNSGWFDVLTPSSVQAKMAQLGLQAPLSRAQGIRLGEATLSGEPKKTAAILEGDILKVKIDYQKQTSEVALAVRLVDVALGEAMVGAVVTGNCSSKGEIRSDDQLMAEAIKDAAYQAVKQMVQYVIPEAKVTKVIGSNQALLSKGSRGGISPHMKMVVVRQTPSSFEGFTNSELVGKVEVLDASPESATATVLLSPKGIQPEDIVRAIYDEPSAAASDGVRVYGEVSKEGWRQLSAGTTIKTLLDSAVPTPQADLEHVTIQRIDERGAILTAFERDMSWTEGPAVTPEMAVNQQPEPAILAGDQVYVPTKWQFQHVGMNFASTPLPEALNRLLNLRNLTYVLDPAIDKLDIKVTATLTGVTVEKALSVICNTAGLSYETKDNILYVKLKQPATSVSAPAVHDEVTMSAPVVYIGKLKYVRSGDIIGQLVKFPGVLSVVSQGEHQLVVTLAGEDASAQVKKLVESLDTPGVYPRAIRVGMIVTGHIKGKAFGFSTENVGLDGESMSLSSKIEGGGYAYFLNGSVKPALQVPDPTPGRTRPISLRGDASFLVLRNVDDKVIEKSFKFAVPVSIERERTAKSGKPGQLKDRPIIASGSATMGANATDFEIRIYADVEKGGVRTAKAE